MGGGCGATRLPGDQDSGHRTGHGKRGEGGRGGGLKSGTQREWMMQAVVVSDGCAQKQAWAGEKVGEWLGR